MYGSDILKGALSVNAAYDERQMAQSRPYDSLQRTSKYINPSQSLYPRLDKDLTELAKSSDNLKLLQRPFQKKKKCGVKKILDDHEEHTEQKIVVIEKPFETESDDPQPRWKQFLQNKAQTVPTTKDFPKTLEQQSPISSSSGQQLSYSAAHHPKPVSSWKIYKEPFKTQSYEESFEKQNCERSFKAVAAKAKHYFCSRTLEFNAQIIGICVVVLLLILLR